MCPEHHWHAHCSTGRRCVGWKGNQKQGPLPLQLFYYMSQSDRVFHLNSEFLMNGQTSCKPFRPEALILPTVHFLDGLPYFGRLCLASLLWARQRGVEPSLWDSQVPPCGMCLKLASLHPLFKCVWSLGKQGEVREDSEKLQRLLGHVCELTDLSLGWQKKGFNSLTFCHLFCDLRCLDLSLEGTLIIREECVIFNSTVCGLFDSTKHAKKPMFLLKQRL